MKTGKRRVDRMAATVSRTAGKRQVRRRDYHPREDGWKGSGAGLVLGAAGTTKRGAGNPKGLLRR